ncbi:MAG TPA: NADPH-dependent 7-cyano-7-deazaguanine reductase QueF [Marinagarivorans sp.]
MTEPNNRFGIELGLGKHQAYEDKYNPALLQPIERQLCRQHLPLQLFNGVDIWTGYELSWLDTTGKPRVAVAEFAIPAASSHIIESKSFKYYLNSFNQTVITDSELKRRLEEDLSRAAGASVTVQITELSAYHTPPLQLQGFSCVDELPLSASSYSPCLTLLQPSEASTQTEQKLYSHLLKSNCPVTGQPDWASVWVSIEGAHLLPESLLAYIVSYRAHQDFHENCVEQIYCDLWHALKPSALWVYARYTRRGGLDINPFRCSHGQVPPSVKAARQ